MEPTPSSSTLVIFTQFETAENYITNKTKPFFYWADRLGFSTSLGLAISGCIIDVAAYVIPQFYKGLPNITYTVSFFLGTTSGAVGMFGLVPNLISMQRKGEPPDPTARWCFQRTV